MCLSQVYPKEKQNGVIKNLTGKGGWIRVWKVFEGFLISPHHHFQFKKGVNRAVAQSKIHDHQLNTYIPYFHMYREEHEAKAWADVFPELEAIECKIRPSWITAIGREGDGEIIVSRKIVV